MRPRSEQHDIHDRLVGKVGPDLYRKNPIVAPALDSILHGSWAEDALCSAVKALATLNEQLMADAVKATMNSPSKPLVAQGQDGKWYRFDPPGEVVRAEAAAREKAFEEAAKIADTWAAAWEKHPLDSGRIRVGMCLSLAERIRALAKKPHGA